MKDCAAAGVQLAARKSSPATARAQNCPMVLPRGRGVAIRGGVVAVRILFAMYLRRRLCAPPRLPLGFWCFWFARRGFGARMLRVCLCYARSVCVCVCVFARTRACVCACVVPSCTALECFEVWPRGRGVFGEVEQLWCGRPETICCN